MFEFLFSNCWNCLGRVRRYGFVEGGILFGAGLTSQKPCPSQCSLNHSCVSKCELSANPLMQVCLSIIMLPFMMIKDSHPLKC